MRYQFSDHAKEALAARGISEEEADALLQNPEQIVPGKKERKIYQSRGQFRNGKEFLLRAIIVEKTNPPIVTTIYLTTNLAKYWVKEEETPQNENDV